MIQLKDTLKKSTNKISLGTAKLGVDQYGYSFNDLPADKIKFLRKSIDIGIDTFDTSPRYGDSEKIIGQSTNNQETKLYVSSKIDGLKESDHNSTKVMVDSVKRSLERLNISKLDICYIHQNELEIISCPFIHEGIFTLKEMGLINYSGASIYSFEELDYSVESSIYDYIQVPVNILDTSYYKRILDFNSEIKIVARSIFLQGIFFQKESIIKEIKYSKPLLDSLFEMETLCRSYGVDFMTACVAYVHSLVNIEQIIIGTASIDNLKNNIKSAGYDLDQNLTKMIDDLSMIPKSWTNPRNWV